MNSNSTFSLSRIWRFLRWQLLLEKRTSLLAVLFLFVVYLIIVFILFINMMNNSHYNDLYPLFYFLTMPSAFIMSGLAYPLLRSKDGTVEFLMMPASNLEKFLVEFVSKYLLIWVIVPILFWLAVQLAGFAVKMIYPHAFIQVFSFKELDGQNQKGFLLGLSLFAFAQSIAFAGAVAFRKQAILKTIAFLAVVLLVVFGFFFFSHDVHGVRNPKVGIYMSNHLLLPTVLCLFSLVVSLIFTFFKLKEKQVS